MNSVSLFTWSFVFEVSGSFSGGFVIVCGDFARLHLFQSANAEEIKQKIVDSALSNLGIAIKVLNRPITLEDFQTQRFGKFRCLGF